MLFARADWLVSKRLGITIHLRRHKIARHQFNFRPIFAGINQVVFYCVVYAKVIILLSVGESGGYLAR